RRASAGGLADYAGISWERLDAGEELFWPCPAEDHPGTPRLFAERFAHPDGLARFVPVGPRGVTERTDHEFPFVLTTGRSRTHYQSGSQTRRSPTLAAAEPEPYAEVHPGLARLLGLTDGAPVRLTTRRGSAELRIRVTDTIRADTVFVPFHWPGVNALTSDRLDATSRMPEFKACAVAVARASGDLVPAHHHEESTG
ncbi:molybdopterin oxidoreductase family protein, partial [Pseudonocardia pini]|uniref:molybdopterin oxidoreductase family protein n=1 Tax=Pseudonocardia pini TaxID=2758030 RepID=UPI001C68CC53